MPHLCFWVFMSLMLHPVAFYIRINKPHLTLLPPQTKHIETVWTK